MADVPAGELRRLRTWRTALLIVTGGGQGVQWMLSPQRALQAPSLARMALIGPTGFQILGTLLLLVAVLLIATSSRPFGHALGFALYLLLVVATAGNGYWPGAMLLFAGLHGGEFYTWAKRRDGR